jgi:N-acylneuraminate cytidylyltransferase
MEILAIIPARGGSKGVPRKNVRPLVGKPLVGWTIEAARNSSTVTRVVVSTDDAEIADVARRHGAETVMRPAEISGDSASSEAALLHVLEQLEQQEQYRPDLVVFLQCTSPLTTPSDIDGVVTRLLQTGADSALACVEFHYFLWRPDEQGQAVGVNHDARRRQLRQERDPQYLEAGSVYVMRTEGFRKARHRFFGKTVLHAVPEEHCFEIDTQHDFLVADTLKLAQLQRDRAATVPQPVAAVVFDFDGVFTDNRVLVAEDGQEAVSCDRGDGLGIARLKAAGVPILVLSSEVNPVVDARCRKLGVECLHGIARKWPALEAWLQDRGLDPSQVVYVGNDLNDLECIANVGCGVSVRDADPRVRAAARLTLQSDGGRGAVRELVEVVLERMELRRAA